jgi:arylsulfatase A-like enzyme
MFRGTQPHEHGIYRNVHSAEQANDSSPLVDALGQMGYTTFGVSSNGFASLWREFDRPFDAFFETGGRTYDPTALNVSQRAKEYDRYHPDANTAEKYADITRDAFTHDDPIGSLANLGTSLAGKLVGRFDRIQSIPHPLFHNYALYNYSARKNTAVIESIIDDAVGEDEPFFVFANYMDTHRPYVPPAEYQREFLGRTLSFDELTTINDEYAPTWDHVRRVENGSVDEHRVEDIRNLYRGEVRSVDDHLGRILSALDARGLRENTLVVVTADHGENLGETDQMGRNRIGHEASVSEAVMRVPLVIAHPELNGRTVTDPVSIKDLFGVFTEGLDALLESGGGNLGPLVPDDGVVVSEYPAVGGFDGFRERHPGVSDEVIRQHTDEHAVVGYYERWKVVLETGGDEWCFEDGEARDLANAPESLTNACRRAIERLVERDRETGELTDADLSQLEALGYI